MILSDCLRQFGYQHKYSAADLVRVITATLEHGDSTLDTKQAVYQGKLSPGLNPKPKAFF